MSEFPITTTLISDDLAMGWQTALDLQISMSPISDSAEIVRTWNAKAINLAAEEFRLFRVEISSSMDMRPPALSGMWPGATFTMVPPSELSDVIMTGGSSRTLIRTPYEGSVRCLTRNFEDVPFSVDGRVVTLEGPALEPVRVYFRPILHLFVVDPWQTTSAERRAEVSWSLITEEQGETSDVVPCLASRMEHAF